MKILSPSLGMNGTLLFCELSQAFFFHGHPRVGSFLWRSGGLEGGLSCGCGTSDPRCICICQQGPQGGTAQPPAAPGPLGAGQVSAGSPVLALTYNLELSPSRSGWCSPREGLRPGHKTKVRPRKQPGSSEIGVGIRCDPRVNRPSLFASQP